MKLLFVDIITDDPIFQESDEKMLSKYCRWLFQQVTFGLRPRDGGDFFHISFMYNNVVI